jgi:enamine deaminase RidA (YjgF/YER057c/UK114 family)
MSQTLIRHNVYSGAPWEKRVAYCRAKRVGAHVFVSGTVAVDEQGDSVGGDSMLEQARYIFAKIERALNGCHAGLRDVVRTRMFVTNIARFEEVAQAHHEAFAGIDPVATCVEIARLVRPELLIEVEVDALLDDAAWSPSAAK